MFISQEYVNKVCLSHERKSALSRYVREQYEYILPVKFDDTSILGLPTDLMYLQICELSPTQLSTKIAQKLGNKLIKRKASDVSPPRMPFKIGELAIDYCNFNGSYVMRIGVLEFATKWSISSYKCIHFYSDPSSINGIALAMGIQTIFQVANAEFLDYTSRVRTPEIGEIVVLRNCGDLYCAILIIKIRDDSRGDERDKFRFQYAIQSDGSDQFTRIEEY